MTNINNQQTVYQPYNKVHLHKLDFLICWLLANYTYWPTTKLFSGVVSFSLSVRHAFSLSFKFYLSLPPFYFPFFPFLSFYFLSLSFLYYFSLLLISMCQYIYVIEIHMINKYIYSGIHFKPIFHGTHWK